MSLKLMYITNSPDVARIAENAGVDRVFVDMEYIGKADRQGGMDTVQSHHTVEDVRNIRAAIKKSDLLVRVNPWHEESAEYCSSKDEIDAVIDAGADVVMLPYFKTVDEVRNFIESVNGRAKTMLLVETCEAAGLIDDILKLKPDEIHIGINDLSLCMGKKFMFELFADGTVEKLIDKCKAVGIPCGVGGIARIGEGTLPAEYVIREHYRLGSKAVILSRSFCNSQIIMDLNEIEKIFQQGVKEIRDFEKVCQDDLANDKEQNFTENKKAMVVLIKQIVGETK